LDSEGYLPERYSEEINGPTWLWEREKLKVAHIAPRMRYGGGTERFVIEVDKAMRGLGAQSRVYSAATILRPDYLGDIAVSLHLGHRAVRDGCDTLFFHQGHEAAMFFRNRKTFSYFHEAKYDLVAGPGGRAYSIFLGEPARRCPQIICNSHFTASRIGAVLKRDDIRIVYPGISIDSEESKRSPEPEPFCYFHSRFHPRKNHDFLLEIFSELPYRLRMTGGTWDQKFGSYQKEIFRRASGKANLLVKGDIDDQTRRLFLGQAALFLFPPRDEPFGLALLEAMAAGKPVIALESGATGEVLGNAGVLCGSSVEDWRRSISSLLLDPEARAVLGQKSLERARLFSWARTAREMIELAEGWN
jgi:glycosyltransferase involved in cell wall biosynthesis